MITAREFSPTSRRQLLHVTTTTTRLRLWHTVSSRNSHGSQAGALRDNVERHAYNNDRRGGRRDELAHYWRLVRSNYPTSSTSRVDAGGTGGWRNLGTGPVPPEVMELGEGVSNRHRADPGITPSTVASATRDTTIARRNRPGWPRADLAHGALKSETGAGRRPSSSIAGRPSAAA
jgi:hypothetical protein